MTETVSASPHLSPAVARSAADVHAALLESLAQQVTDVLRPLVPADRPVALLDAPLTPNVGDSMIWTATLQYLGRRGIHPCYTCTNRSFSSDTLERRIENGTILLSGGGNFGDLYPDHQEFREEILTRFPNNPVIQLPQSIHFASREALAATRQVLDRHRNFTLLVREQASYEIARAQFRAPTQLCPDISFLLGPIERPAAPAHDVVWLARADKEAREPLAEVYPGVLRFDWMQDDLTPRVALYRRLIPVVAHREWLRGLLADFLSHEAEVVARASVERGSRLLSQGRVVVTSRLHGHLLCMLLGIRHVVLDNSYGKVHGAFDTWTHGSPLVQLAGSHAEALARASALAATEH